LSFDFSQAQASNFVQNLDHKFYNDNISNKSNDVVINPDNVTIHNDKNPNESDFSGNNRSDVDYLIDFKKEEITIKINSQNFSPTLAFYRHTFENYIKDTECFLKNKYKKNKKKIKNIEEKMEIIRAKMLAKMINETFELRNFIIDKKSSKSILNLKVESSVKLVLKINVPNNELKYLNRYKNFDRYNLNIEDSKESLIGS